MTQKIRVVTVQFDFDESLDYACMLAVFEKSVRKIMPDAEFICHRIMAPVVPAMIDPSTHDYRNRPANAIGDSGKSKRRAMTANNKKLKIWCDEMERANCPIVFCDCDMLLTGDLAGLFQIDEPGKKHFTSGISIDFDVAFTARTSGKFPINGGAVYARPTENARRFFSIWRANDSILYNDRRKHRPFREKYAGMNQASLGLTLEQDSHGAKIARIPCSIWNACDDDWIAFSPTTRLVHIKGKMRRAVLSDLPVKQLEDYLQPVARIWRETEKI